MMRRNMKKGLCDCFDCGSGDYKGRAWESRAFQSLADEGLLEWSEDAKAVYVAAVTDFAREYYD